MGVCSQHIIGMACTTDLCLVLGYVGEWYVVQLLL